MTILARAQLKLNPGAQGGGILVADPAQLPLAASGAGSVLPNTATVAGLQSPLAAGGSYTDPYTGVTVHRLTSNTSPAAGSFEPSYAEGGPSCSQPWVGGDGKTYYTILVRTGGTEYLIDIRYDLIGVSDPRSNMRTVTLRGEIGIAFSLDPATPRIAYILNTADKRLDRYDTATNAIANTGFFPWLVAAAGSATDWLFTQLNDTWLVAFLNVGTTVIAWKPSTGVEISLAPARQLGTTANEPRLDREDPIVYVDNGLDNVARPVWRLETDTVIDARDYDLTPRIVNWEHGGALRGGVVGLATEQGVGTEKGAFHFRSDTTPPTTNNFITTAAGFHAASTDGYESGHWCMNLRSTDRAAQWFIVDSFLGDTAGAKIRQNMIAWANTGNGEVRLVAASGSSALVYDAYPQPFTSPDGKLLFWTSDMNNSGRFDAFMAKMPVS